MFVLQNLDLDDDNGWHRSIFLFFPFFQTIFYKIPGATKFCCQPCNRPILLGPFKSPDL